MIVVDTGVWIDYFNGDSTPETEILDLALGEEAIAIGDLILVEILQGFRSDSGYKTAKKYLAELQQVEMLGTDMAIKAAENYRKLRKKGATKKGKSPGFAGGPEEFDSYGSPSERLRFVSRQAHDSGESRWTSHRA